MNYLQVTANVDFPKNHKTYAVGFVSDYDTSDPSVLNLLQSFVANMTEMTLDGEEYSAQLTSVYNSVVDTTTTDITANTDYNVYVITVMDDNTVINHTTKVTTKAVNEPADVSVTTHTFDVTNPGMYYLFNGNTEQNPTIYGNLGDTFVFNKQESGHPFYIKTVLGSGDEGAINVDNNGASSVGTTITWTPSTAGVYYYQCGVHASMNGVINVS